MKSYSHLSYQEVNALDNYLLSGKSMRSIAVFLGRAVSTISRQLSRHGGALRYRPCAAYEKYQENKQAKRQLKIEKHAELKTYIIEKLRAGWAPVIVSARWNMLEKDVSVSGETIYQWIYSAEAKHLELYKLLARSKKRRGLRRCRKQAPVTSKVPLDKRPEEANCRRTVGHCEADLVFWKGSQSLNVLTVIDRKTRFVAIVKNKSKHADTIEKALQIDVRERLPFDMLTCAFDNGCEFAHHKKFGIPAYFCKPHSPWEKGSIEQFNGMLRQRIPFRESLRNVTQEKLDRIAYAINNIPRKSLGFLSPIEMLEQLFYQKSRGVALQT